MKKLIVPRLFPTNPHGVSFYLAETSRGKPETRIAVSSSASLGRVGLSIEPFGDGFNSSLVSFVYVRFVELVGGGQRQIEKVRFIRVAYLIAVRHRFENASRRSPLPSRIRNRMHRRRIPRPFVPTRDRGAQKRDESWDSTTGER